MSINEIIAEYIAAKDAENSAKKRAANMKALILDYAKDADNFTTEEYTVVIKSTPATRLDTDALYRDFPDIKETYGKTTVSKTVNAVPTANAQKKSA